MRVEADNVHSRTGMPARATFARDKGQDGQASASQTQVLILARYRANRPTAEVAPAALPVRAAVRYPRHGHESPAYRYRRPSRDYKLTSLKSGDAGIHRRRAIEPYC